ncbi:hypothetical protein ABZ705_03770 [Streptomyces sp. NPDC006984]|uniref:hypothetical protein n=1 Tax=Streptomyces sp. NPDC006984 TaxID=3155463 RepID=UPI0033CEF724
MTSYPGAVGDNGAVSRLLDLAIACNETPGAELDDELARFCRTVRNSPEASWAMPVATITAVLDLLSEYVEEKEPGQLSAGFTERVVRAAAGIPVPEYLRLLSGLVRIRDREPVPDFAALPMADWEAELRFDRIGQFWWYVDSGEYELFDEGVREGVSSEHPNGCRIELSALAAQLQTALILFPTTASMAEGLGKVAPSASPLVLQAVLDAIHRHFAEEH